MTDPKPARFLDVGDMSPAEIFRRLYNASFSMGMGRLHFKADDMTLAQAQAMIDEWLAGMVERGSTPEQVQRFGLHLDYVRGRVLKVNLLERPLFVGLYDRDNGPGAAARALGVADVEAKREEG